MCEKSVDTTIPVRRKIVALSPRLIENVAYPEIRDAVDIRWGEFLVECGAIPLVLPSALGAEHFAALSPEGLLLTGGNDLNVLSPNPLSERRDNFERQLLGYAIENDIAVLGICRGFQFIADYFGATLEKTAGHVAVRHRLVEPFCGLVEVNSFHSWGVFNLPDCLEELARTEDGCIEAFRHRILPISAVMWHPEREKPFFDSDRTFVRTALNL